jgi:centromeric protein E
MPTPSKRIKASVSTEVRQTRSHSKALLSLTTKTTLPTVPGSPSRSTARPGSSLSRPGTPVRRPGGANSPMPASGVSEMDVSRVDPEHVLVDSETVECEGEGDVSLDIDMENSLDEEEAKKDKVMVSIRYVSQLVYSKSTY